MITHRVSTRVTSVSLYPYEHDILPPIWTTISSQVGSMPDVQFLSQAIDKGRASKNSSDDDALVAKTEFQLIFKFAMRLDAHACARLSG